MTKDAFQGPLSVGAAHLCIDMQRVFSEPTEWHVPWLHRVLPKIVRLARTHPADTIFTKFMPPARPEEMKGAWRPYYERWRQMTREKLDPHLLDLVPDLAGLVPPARVVEKYVYSPFSLALDDLLQSREIDTLVITGAETDVCVLAGVLGAVDRGYRVVLASDGLCSVSDEGHDALMRLFGNRFSIQIEVATVDAILAAWP